MWEYLPRSKSLKKNVMKNILLFVGLLFLTSTLPIFGQDNTPTDNIIYVKHDAEGDGSGSSWEHAVPELADALL